MLIRPFFSSADSSLEVVSLDALMELAMSWCLRGTLIIAVLCFF